MAKLNLITSQFNLIIFEKMIKLNQLMIMMFPYTIFPVTPPSPKGNPLALPLHMCYP